jgi:protein PsiE
MKELADGGSLNMLNRKVVEKGYAVVLELGMLLLGLVMVAYFARELWTLATTVMDVHSKIDYYAVAEIILEAFLFFEFIVLTREYFVQGRISLENFLYIGITAMLRTLLVYHDDIIGVLIQAAAVAILVLVLIAYRISRHRITKDAHEDHLHDLLFQEEHPDLMPEEEFH